MQCPISSDLGVHLRSQGHVQQDKWFYEHIFGPCSVTKGFFVDVGAYGEEGSNTWFYEKALNWDGILIEPNALRIDELKRTRKSQVLNIAINDEPGKQPFLQIESVNSQLSGLVNNYDPRWTAMLDSHYKRLHYNQDVVDVDCHRLQDVFDDMKIQHVDLMSVDTEGSEMKVLKSVDWNKTDITAVCVEDAHSDLPAPAFMEAQGYTVVHRQWPDIFFVKTSFLKNNNLVAFL